MEITTQSVGPLLCDDPKGNKNTMRFSKYCEFVFFNLFLLGACGLTKFKISSRTSAAAKFDVTHVVLSAKHTINSRVIDDSLQPVSNFCLIKVKESMGETVRNL